MAKAWGADAFWPYAFLWTTLFVVHGQLAAQHGNFSIYLLAAGLAPLIVFALREGTAQPPEAACTPQSGPCTSASSCPTPCCCERGPPGWRTDAPGSFSALLMTFAADTGAFFVGKLVGSHRMAPTVSPGKTWEDSSGVSPSPSAHPWTFVPAWPARFHPVPAYPWPSPRTDRSPGRPGGVLYEKTGERQRLRRHRTGPRRHPR